MQTAFAFAQTSRESSVPPHWVLLDSQSTVSVFMNPKYLTNIRKSSSTVVVHTNGGTQTSTLIGDVTNFGPVWYNPESLANILSLAARSEERRGGKEC